MKIKRVAKWILIVLTFAVLVYPLSILALGAILIIATYPFTAVKAGVTLSDFISILTAIGGLLGYAGLVKSICGIKNKTTLFFLISGLFAYYHSIVGLSFSYGSHSLIQSLKLLSFQESFVLLWSYLPFLLAIIYSLIIVISLVKK